MRDPGSKKASAVRVVLKLGRNGEIFFLSGEGRGRGNGFKRAASAGSVQVLGSVEGTWGQVPPPGDGRGRKKLLGDCGR